MDDSCSNNIAYITCCLIIASNIIYLIFTFIKLYFQYRRRQYIILNKKMTDKQNETIKTGFERLSQLYPHISEETHLPTKWNSKEKSSNLMLQQNNLIVTYKGAGKSHKDAASVRSDHPIPSLTGIYYYEVKILSKGRDGYMGIGLSTGETSLHRLPGWDKGTYGYHGDDGKSFCSSSSGVAYGPTFTTGNYVGCCVNFIENICFYTHNGCSIGTSFRDIPSEIYPTVGLQTPNESLEANFGFSPFKFDIDKYMNEFREKTRRAILECTIKENELLHQNTLRRIVSSYLVHYGYCSTAEQFNKNAENVYTDELNSMRNRQLIQDLIRQGYTTDAIEKTKELFPTLLNNKNLLFVLKVRQFIEMINETEKSNENSSKIECYPITNGIRTSLSQDTKTTVNSTSSNHNLMDIEDNDDEIYKTKIRTVSYSSNTESKISNGHIDNDSNNQQDNHLLMQILQFGKELHTLRQQLYIEYGENTQYDKMLQDAYSLLAYPDPKTSPLAYLFEPSQRESVSSVLNSAILEAHNMPRHPALEVLVGYLNECDKLMHKNQIADCAFIELNKYLR